jgi:hypothetical protein
MRRRDPEWWLSWSPVATRGLGYFGVLFVAAVWFVTTRFEPILLGFFGSLIAGGEGLDAIKDFRRTAARAPEAPTVPAPAEAPNGA